MNQEKKSEHEPPATEVKVGQVEKSIAQQIIERKKEAARRYREKNRGKLAAAERARRGNPLGERREGV